MIQLKWLYPKQIYQHYLNNEAVTDDDTLVLDLNGWRDELAFENSVYERSGAKAEDRWAYKRNTEPLQTLIRKAEASVFELMMKQAEEGRWVGVGRQHPDAKEEIIPSRYWAFLKLDINTVVAKGDDMTFRSIRGLIWRQIPKGHQVLDLIRAAEKLPEPSELQQQQFQSNDEQRRNVAKLPETTELPQQLRSDDGQGRDVSGINIEMAGTHIIKDNCVEPSEIVISRGPGRPSSRDLVLGEHCLRRIEGRCEETQRLEARALVRWVLRNQPNALSSVTLQTAEKYLRDIGAYPKQGPCSDVNGSAAITKSERPGLESKSPRMQTAAP